MDVKLPKLKLSFDSYKTARNKLAFMFDQNCTQVLKKKNSTKQKEQSYILHVMHKRNSRLSFHHKLNKALKA